MSYGYGFGQMMDILRESDFIRARIVESGRREIHHGLLSVGIKLHILDRDTAARFQPLLEKLGGRPQVIHLNVYRHSAADMCLVLHPVGSAHCAILFLRALETFTRCKIFGNPYIQIQVCSPGKLDMRRSALLGMCFYLCSDTLRRYELEDFQTTVSEGPYRRGKRLVLYDAGGDFDSGFEWPVASVAQQERNRWRAFKKVRREKVYLPLGKTRTDILAGTASELDIRNINLFATLLCHAQYPQHSGYWHELGKMFEKEVLALLDEHVLAGLTDAPWVSVDRQGDPDDDERFISAMQELVAYAFLESERIQQGSAFVGKGILETMRSVSLRYRTAVEEKYPISHGEAQ